MQTVLSLDVDYFVRPKVTSPDSGTRPDDLSHNARDLAEVDQFLRERCLLTTERKTPGLAALDHSAAFDAIQKWMAGAGLKVPFRIVHIDAHADLGLGDAGYAEIVEKLLYRRPEDRATSLQYFGSGNWLAYAIANRWIEEVLFLREADQGLDSELLAYFFCDSQDWSVLRMRPMTETQLFNVTQFNRHEYAGLPTQEPPVKWTRVDEVKFTLTQPPDFLFTCLSPEYSPPQADSIFELVKTFIL